MDFWRSLRVAAETGVFRRLWSRDWAYPTSGIARNMVIVSDVAGRGARHAEGAGRVTASIRLGPATAL
jgi:hypothetical protein